MALNYKARHWRLGCSCSSTKTNSVSWWTRRSRRRAADCAYLPFMSGCIPGMCAASPFLRSFTFSITLYLSCGSRVTRSVQDPTSTASKHSSALVFSRTPSIHLCLVPLTMHRCKSSTLPVLYSTGAVKDMSGTTAGSTEDDRSKVLKRVLEKKSKRSLMSKEKPLVPGALADYIRPNERAYDERNKN